ncbi:cysteinyl leukotriene receptor 2-like [Paramormyrops kingsleyae]|uniref:cysteinyl leukotriene receptor 2-like n=1 Tax=Paramormyrops kingsleyae TaxID=1676925 RepID=UPI003B9746CE
MQPYLVNGSNINGNMEPDSLNQSTEFCGKLGNAQGYCYIVLGLCAVALPLGILGNIIALVNYTCFRKTWTTSNIFLLNLALCDLAWILTLPFTIYFNLQRSHLGGIQIFCKFKKISFNVNTYGSIMFLTFVSFDRYAGTVHPIRSLMWWDVGKAKVCCVCTWTLLLIGSVPDLFFTFAVKGNVLVCVDQTEIPFSYIKTFSIVRAAIGFVLPFGMMLTFYVMTVKVLRRLPRSTRVRQRFGKPLLLLSAAILVFVVSFGPYHVMALTVVLVGVQKQVTNRSTLYICYEFSKVVCAISSCLDPILYILAGGSFHKSWLALTRQRCMHGGCMQGGCRCRCHMRQQPVGLVGGEACLPTCIPVPDCPRVAWPSPDTPGNASHSWTRHASVKEG